MMSWNPGVTPRGDVYAAAAGQSLAARDGQMVDDYFARRRQREAMLGQYAELLNAQQQDAAGGELDAAGNAAPAGDTPDALLARGKQGKALLGVMQAYNLPGMEEAQNWSVDQLEGHIKGHVLATAEGQRRQEQQLRAQELQARLGQYAAQEERLRDAASGEQAAGQFVLNALNAPGVAVPAAGTGDNADMLGPEADYGRADWGLGSRPRSVLEGLRWAAANTPGMSGRYAPQALTAFSKLQQALGNYGQSEGIFTREDIDQPVPTGYHRVPTGRNTSVVVSDLTGMPVAEVPGFTAVPGRSGPTYLKTPAAREPGSGPVVSQDGQFYWEEKDQIWKPIRVDATESLMRRAGEIGGGGKAAPAKSERVTVSKGGKKFTVPRSQVEEAKKQGYEVGE